jgi:hypothetical protein
LKKKEYLEVMMIDEWDEIRDELIADGMTMDIYIKDVMLDDWRIFINFVTNKYKTKFTSIEKDPKLPEYIDASFFDLEKGQGLSIEIGSVWLECYFYTPLEIELFFDPEDIASEIDLESILEFMRSIGDKLEKCVLLTPENLPEKPIFKYKPQ